VRDHSNAAAPRPVSTYSPGRRVHRRLFDHLHRSPGDTPLSSSVVVQEYEITKYYDRYIYNVKKRSERRKHCALAVVRRDQKFSSFIFAPPQTPFLGAQDGQNLISWRWPLPPPTEYRPSLVKIDHAISSYRGNRPTNKQIKKHTHQKTNPQIGPITIHCVAKLIAQCNEKALLKA